MRANGPMPAKPDAREPLHRADLRDLVAVERLALTKDTRLVKAQAVEVMATIEILRRHRRPLLRRLEQACRGGVLGLGRTASFSGRVSPSRTKAKAPFATQVPPTHSTVPVSTAVKTTGRQTAFVLSPPRPSPTTNLIGLGVLDQRSIEALAQLLAGLEERRKLLGHRHLVARSRIAPGARLTLPG